MKFSEATREALKHYVYALIDPRDSSVFYVGKAASTNRPSEHLQATARDTKKSTRIKEIRTENLEPRIDILRYGLSADVVFEVEAAVIDALGLETLTNAIRGHGVERGRLTAAEVERLHGHKAIDLEAYDEPLILFFLSKSY
ncbi:LEM-3-like GIY-YIG domain-containing protein [Achromobacter aloeverae]